MTRPQHPLRTAATATAIALLLLAGGCATVQSPGAPPVNPDPWENFNRKVYSFNDAVDKAVLKPVAQVYRDVVPKLVRTGIDNVFGNIRDVWSAANHLLQGKVHNGLDMGMRVLTNTIFGLGGLLDPATEIGLERHSEDFGQTLGHWGIASGPYLVLPLLGASTVRDTAGFIVDRQASPATLLTDTSGVAYAITGVEFVNVRANLLQTGDLVDQVALDRYTFIRDGYLARRRDAIYDGKPPTDAFSYDTDDSSGAPAVVAPGTAATTAAPTASAPASGAALRQRPAASAPTPAPAPASATAPATAPAAPASAPR